MVSLYGTRKRSRMCAVGNIAGRSESEQMMTPTRGCLWENPDCVLGTAGADLRVRFRGWRYMSHFATLAALRLAVRVYARTQHNKSRLFKFRISDMSFEVVRKSSIAAEGTLRAVEPTGRERMVRKWFSYSRSRMPRWCNGPSREVKVQSRLRESDPRRAD